jgi:hypothetical protein
MIDARILRAPTIAVLITIGLGVGAVAKGQPVRVRGATQQAAPRHLLPLDPQPLPAIACPASAGAPFSEYDISTGTTTYGLNYGPSAGTGPTWPMDPPSIAFWPALAATFSTFTKILSPQARWIWIFPPRQTPNISAGFYNYEVRFVVPTCSIPFTSVQVVGRFAADNSAVVSLDGQTIASSGGQPNHGP